MTDEEKANIKYRLSDLGVKVGELALEYIEQLEKENKICEEIIIGEQQEINDLQKENAELKEQNKSLIETLCAIATDTNEHITHNVAQNELDKWS